jgi:hypothetical protein
MPWMYLEVYMVVLEVGQSVVGIMDEGITPLVADVMGASALAVDEDPEDADGVDEELEDGDVLDEERKSVKINSRDIQYIISRGKATHTQLRFRPEPALHLYAPLHERLFLPQLPQPRLL